MNRPEGYRYVRQYSRGDDRSNWALYEVRDGRARRVGTARNEDDYHRFLGLYPCPQCKQEFPPGKGSDPHNKPDGTRCVFVMIYLSYFTEDDIHDGDIDYSNQTEQIVDCLPDEWDDEGTTVVDKALAALDDEGLGEPSSSPNPGPGDWFGHVDGSYTTNYHTGERCEPSGHLWGFTDDEAREVFARNAEPVRR